MNKVEQYFAPLKQNLIFAANSDYAAYMKGYMKNRFEFYGLKQKERRLIFNDFVKSHGLCDYEEIEGGINWLYKQPEREYDYCAMELILKFKRKWQKDVIEHAEYLITHNSWWDTVDLIATNVVGAYLLKHKEMIAETIPKWIESEDMWLNRTAIIFQLKFKTETDTYWLTKAILPHIDSNEFFHQKAIGWALRQHSKSNPNWVVDFVNEHELKPLSKREALRLIGK